MPITRQRAAILIGCVLVFLAGWVYALVYRPLLSQLKIQGASCREIENAVLQARSEVTFSKKEGKKIGFIGETEVSLAMEELTRQGKLRGINFISITPRDMVTSEEGGYQILPIEMETESGYESLGLFLGSLDELERGLVTVRGFHVRPVEGKPSRLEADLVVNLYVAQ